MNRSNLHLHFFVQKRWNSIDYLLKSIPQSPRTTNIYQSSKSSKSKKSKNLPSERQLKSYRNSIVSPLRLNEIYSPSWRTPYKENDLVKSRQFFGNARVELDWTLADYDEIPDVKYAKLAKEREEKLSSIDPYSRNETTESMLNSRKTFGIRPELLRALPEVLFMGHTNVGKSSLINGLLVKNKSITGSTQLAYVSARAGFTKTINCFNFSKKLRIIDSPGYGEYGDLKQGKVVVDYISRRHQLKKVYVLIDSVEGFREEDSYIFNLLIDEGVPFDIIFTKVDNVVLKYIPKNAFEANNCYDLIQTCNDRVVEHYGKLITSSGLQDIAMTPTFLFSNANTNKFLPKPAGMNEIQSNILDSCNLL